ncbi:hypothetical protein BC834DRAFT_967136 [Gloeopeniophorella convolvens]|nr:hypothetical protein BC834DRAFT_967136 [Gloeopeniophorella convolvens]
MASFSRGSPSAEHLAGHGYNTSLADFVLDHPLSNAATVAQYQRPPQFASPSTHVATSHVLGAAARLPGPYLKPTAKPSTVSTTAAGGHFVFPTFPTMTVELPRAPSPPPDDNSSQEKPQGRSRKRLHSCTMCEKAFDRPSTLKKHMLVHTGEKAYICDICDRRFSVASNLNRHKRRCALRPVNALRSSPARPAQSGDAEDGAPGKADRCPRGHREASATDAMSDSTLSSNSSPTPPAPRRMPLAEAIFPGDATLRPRKKRPRRAPTPTNWVPKSLFGFDLQPSNRCCPVPLAPVHPSLFDDEERDSCIMDMPDNPYHPDGWIGRLPGPACGSFYNTGIIVLC